MIMASKEIVMDGDGIFGQPFSEAELQREDFQYTHDGEVEYENNADTGRKSKVNVDIAHALNEKVVCGENGLTALIGIFKKVTFKQQRSESEKLDFLLKKYEFWAHKLFPRLHFDDVVHKVEELGSKKMVQRQALSLMQSESASEKSYDDIVDEKGI